MLPPHPNSTLFPYTTLFRSNQANLREKLAEQQARIEELHKISFDNVSYDAWRSETGQILDQVFGYLDSEQRSEEHTSELQSPYDLVCRLLLEKKKYTKTYPT